MCQGRGEGLGICYLGELCARLLLLFMEVMLAEVQGW
jgi:hypothetical protein